MLLKIAWLNIWRNKRRTLITMASVFFAVLLAIIMSSSINGNFDNMIRNIVSFSSGYAQVHSKGYWNEQTIDNAFNENKGIEQLIEADPDVMNFMPRLESFALASGEIKTKGVMVIGIDPAKEKLINKLDQKIITGAYMSSVNDNAVVLGEGLSGFLHLKVNDTIVLIGQGYHGTSAAGKFSVKGIVRLGSPQLNDNLVYLPMKKAQEMYAADNMITSLSVMMNDPKSLDKMIGSLQSKLDTNVYEVMSWKQMLPEIDQFIEADSAGHFIFIYILYFIISFGIFSTILMMTMERTHEFGILVAIGMQKYKLSLLLLYESLMISSLGCLAGIIAGYALVAWFVKYPIEFTGQLREAYVRYGLEPIISLSMGGYVFIEQALIILVLTSLLALYPGIKLLKMKPVKAINS